MVAVVCSCGFVPGAVVACYCGIILVLQGAFGRLTLDTIEEEEEEERLKKELEEQRLTVPSKNKT